MASDEHIAVHLALEVAQGVAVAPRDDLVPVAEADLEALDGDDFLLGVGGVFVELASHDVDLGGDALEKVVCFFGAEVACAEDVVDLPGDKKGLELVGDLVGAGWDVQVTNDENENHLWVGLGWLYFFFCLLFVLMCAFKKKRRKKKTPILEKI